MSGMMGPPPWQTNAAANQPGQVGAGNYTSLLNGISPPPSMAMVAQQPQNATAGMPAAGQGGAMPPQFQPQQPPMFMPGQQPSVGQLGQQQNLAMFGQAGQQPPGNTNYLAAILQAIHAAGGGAPPPINAANVPTAASWNPSVLLGSQAAGGASQAPPGITSIGQIPGPPPPAPPPATPGSAFQDLFSGIQHEGTG